MLKEMRANLIKSKTALLSKLAMDVTSQGLINQLAQVDEGLDKLGVAIGWQELYLQGITPQEAHERGILPHTKVAKKRIINARTKARI